MVNVACAHLMWNGHEPHSLKNSGYRKDMFFKYTWNNFLHTQVEICIALILASPLESTENGIITDQDSIGDNLLLKHVTTCHIHSSSDDEIDFKETVFSQDSSLQQMQQMTSNFIDQFGFNDEKFADQDDIGNVSFDRVSDINFTLNTNESPKEVLLWRPAQMEKMMWKMQTR
ncbi:serine/threonine-protein phosphatase 6 regulatory subunit 3-like isoform X2 [Chrysemys picta bellii]|uniref:serine/threonine-protein phosphatase 6 regulatory subunit 3-like isoform X2 n=1 Tax=Chrysemys picta bellii TaxID=8478 RepID=UPI0032B2253D